MQTKHIVNISRLGINGQTNIEKGERNNFQIWGPILS